MNKKKYSFCLLLLWLLVKIEFTPPAPKINTRVMTIVIFIFKSKRCFIMIFLYIGHQTSFSRIFEKKPPRNIYSTWLPKSYKIRNLFFLANYILAFTQLFYFTNFYIDYSYQLSEIFIVKVSHTKIEKKLGKMKQESEGIFPRSEVFKDWTGFTHNLQSSRASKV